MSSLRRVLLLLAGLTLALLIGEGLVRAFAPQNLSGRWRTHSRRGYLLNMASTRARHQSGKTVVHYRFNELHLRGGPIRPEGLRVLVLGDSFTFGWLLEEEETFVGRFQQMSDRDFGPGAFQFLNGGAGGWGTAHAAAFLEDYGNAIAPAAVLVVINTDDIGRSLRQGLYEQAEPGTLELAPAPPPARPHLLRTAFTRSAAYRWMLGHSHLLQLARRVWLNLSLPTNQREWSRSETDPPIPGSTGDAAELEAAPALGNALFRRMGRWCSRRGCRLLVTTTGWHGWPRSWQDRDLTAAFMKQAAPFLKEEGVPFHDISDDVMAASETNIFSIINPEGGHPSVKGALLIAELVWPWLKPQLESAFPEVARR